MAFGKGTKTDIELWNDFRNGERHALGVLMERHYKDLFNYSSKFSNDKNKIKDCIQDLFYELLNNLENTKEVQFVKTYLLKSLRRKLYRESLKAGVIFHPEEWEEDLFFNCEFSVENQLIEEESNAESTKKLTELLNKLPKRQKEILYLRFYQNLDHSQIASVMTISGQAAYNLLYKAIKQLKELYSGSSISL